MEGVRINGNISSFDLSLADIKPDLGTIPLWISVKQEEKTDDESLSHFRGRPFRIRNPASVLKLRRDLEKLKQEKDSIHSSSSINGKTNTANTCTPSGYVSLVTKVDKISKNLEEFRKQWLQANGINSGDPWPMSTEYITTPSLQNSSQETVISMEAASEEPRSLELAIGGGSSANNPPVIPAADEPNSNGDEQHEHEDSTSFSPSTKSQLYPLVPNHIDITVLPGKPAWYRCNICQKRFIMKAHIMNHDNCQKGDNLFKCEQCGRGFITKSHYEYHVKIHERQVKGCTGTRERVGNYKGPRYFLPSRFY